MSHHFEGLSTGYLLAKNHNSTVNCLFVCLFFHRLFTPASTPKGEDFCVHCRFYSRIKGSSAPSSGRFDMHAENLSRESIEGVEEGG